MADVKADATWPYAAAPYDIEATRSIRHYLEQIAKAAADSTALLTRIVELGAGRGLSREYAAQMQKGVRAIVEQLHDDVEVPLLYSMRELERLLTQTLCKNERCDNDARYDSGYCGVCDVTHNGGRGLPR